MRPFFELDPEVLRETAFEQHTPRADATEPPPVINLTNFSEFVQRRMAGIVHTAGTITFLKEQQDIADGDPNTRDTVLWDQFKGWMADGIRRDRVECAMGGTDTHRHTVSHNDKDKEYKRDYGKEDGSPDTWTNLLYSTDPNVCRIVREKLRGDNTELTSELMYTLCTQLMHLCYDFMVNIWQHVGTTTPCCHQCAVLYKQVHDLLDNMHERDPPEDLVRACLYSITELVEAATLIYEKIDSLVLYTTDPRAVNPTRWTGDISYSATMRDGKWNEAVLVERALVHIYRELLSSTRPLLCMQHTTEWNQLLRPGDLDAGKWEVDINHPPLIWLPDLDVAPFTAWFDKLHNSTSTPGTSMHDLLGAMPGVNVITLNSPVIHEDAEGAEIRVMDVQLSFDLVGETDDVHTVLFIYKGTLGLCVFQRQNNRFEHAKKGDRPDHDGIIDTIPFLFNKEAHRVPVDVELEEV
jgi:hypothetical protein